MDITTGKGDDGRTDLLFGGRVPKDHPRMEACGAVDELSAFLGLARAEMDAGPAARLVLSVQQDLFILGAELAAAPGRADRLQDRPGPGHARRLEEEIERLEGEGDTQNAGFATPGANRISALLHICRAVARRAERRAWFLHRQDGQPPAHVPIYLNRLGDLLWLLARRAAGTGGADVTPGGHEAS